MCFACFQLVFCRKPHNTFSRTLFLGPIFIIAGIFLAMKQFLLVRYSNMNFLKYLTICPWNCASCRMSLLLILYNCHWLLQPLLQPLSAPAFTAIPHGSHRGGRLPYTIRRCFHTFQLVRIDFRPTPALFFCPRARWCSHFLPCLTTALKNNFDELKFSFWQQWEPNADVLKTQLKSIHQLPGQDVYVS